MGLMVLSAGLAVALHPTVNLADIRPPIDLKAVVPTAFGNWHEQLNFTAQIINPQQEQKLTKTYSATLARTYINTQGYRVMLSVAYGKNQRGDLQLHHPELCYPAQGFQVLSNHNGQLVTPMGAIPVRRLETRLNSDRNEPITYWATIGEHIALGSVRRKIAEMRYGFQGQVADGLLFRVSSIDTDSTAAFEQQRVFVAALLEALSPHDRRRIADL
jgi:EpsI family protein